ncbi:MAG: sigma-70 family RNA polymerase sigma factor [Merismopedia sp. SIO2A8]|nr:sigma-70 family RNA polymerase sigma factor [Symploca sp. SIO2B6]NET53837.1 sigma-70 family RNA polymerase sigma factor [Merismopedia sp. SIO2A8]
MRNTFRLHFYQQRTHTEIAEEQGITDDNVCKLISLNSIGKFCCQERLLLLRVFNIGNCFEQAYMAILFPL